MFKYFTTDRVITSEALKAVNWKNYDIELRMDDPLINGLPSATLIHQGSKLLVRFTVNDNLSHLVPIDIQFGSIPHILNVIGYCFHTAITTEYDGPPRYIQPELEEAGG